MRQRIADWIVKYRFVLFALWLVHVFYIHYFLIGFVSWDGFGHRGFPIIELFQHGDMGKEKFYEWSLKGYTPFIELAHIPFLWLFKLRGLIIGFPLIVFPLCVFAVYAFVHELTNDKRAATFGAFTYAAIPMVNQQPFSGYIDFAVIGILAFWLYALLGMRHENGRGRAAVRLVVATFLFSMSRSQGPYVLVVMFPLLAIALFVAREGWRPRITDRRALLLAILAVCIGMAPAAALQIWKYMEFGSPVAPMQLSFLGIKVGDGVSMNTYFQYAGLGGADIGSLMRGFWDGWVWHAEWPLSAFYSSRLLAAGLLFLLAIVVLPVFARRASRVEWWILGTGMLVSLLSKDFAVPRWGYTTMLAISLIVGRSLSTLADTPRWRGGFWVVLVILGAHLLRPEFDLLQLRTRASVTPQMNVSASKHFVDGGWEVQPYPDHSYKFVIIQAPANNFILPLYGRRLRNEVLGSVLSANIGPRCTNLQWFTLARPDVLYVDDLDYTKNCPRECVISSWYCRAWRIKAP